jgi:hypothetical protein
MLVQLDKTRNDIYYLLNFFIHYIILIKKGKSDIQSNMNKSFLSILIIVSMLRIAFNEILNNIFKSFVRPN